ncbi:zinc finger CCCH domain-containing protein 18-like [Andrographis paniculata]|uniref:zinc finger CCCH domain-containing protein 18-like n=1 Tax=Andrographis paniculata TaxID=175694 RepID=UPI0021E771EE|nr:zinc finger CCCH domain-containing protein 18-like [Andrographis paniculata]
MEYSESTKIVFQRIQKFDPENVSKLMGYLLFKDQREEEMIRLALGPDYMIQNLIDQLKHELGIALKSVASSHASSSQASRPASNLPATFTPFVPASSRLPALAPLPANNAQWIPQIPHAQQLIPNAQFFPTPGFVNPVAVNPTATGFGVLTQPQLPPLEDQLGSLSLAGTYGHPQSYNPVLALHQTVDQKAPSVSPSCPETPEIDLKICESYQSGYCEYGGDCKDLHVIRTKSGYYMVLNTPTDEKALSSNPNLPHGDLRQLEIDFIDILKSRRGIPVTILSLPFIYFDRYEKVLQLEPYIAEARAQGFTGDANDFLAQMSKSFCVINRPYGMQSIILEDDIPRYLKFVEEATEQDPIGACLHQIYLTYPPQSDFTEQDVHSYFSHFGPVKEIRIPVQEKRMYGFVTFACPETASLVLSKSNPHLIRGAQVLVKPYQHKRATPPERKPEQKVQLHASAAPYIPLSLTSLRKEHEVQGDYKMKHVGASSSQGRPPAGQTSGSSSFPEGPYIDDYYVFSMPSSYSNREAQFDPAHSAELQSFNGIELSESPFSF